MYNLSNIPQYIISRIKYIVNLFEILIKPNNINWKVEIDIIMNISLFTWITTFRDQNRQTIDHEWLTCFLWENLKNAEKKYPAVISIFSFGGCDDMSPECYLINEGSQTDYTVHIYFLLANTSIHLNHDFIKTSYI